MNTHKMVAYISGQSHIELQGDFESIIDTSYHLLTNEVCFQINVTNISTGNKVELIVSEDVYQYIGASEESI